MNAEQFTMWLHGFFEISGAEGLDIHQTKIIKDHLNLLFNKVTPDRKVNDTGNPFPFVNPYNYPRFPDPLNTKILC